VREPITLLKRLVVVNKFEEAELFVEVVKNVMRNTAEWLAVGEVVSLRLVDPRLFPTMFHR